MARTLELKAPTGLTLTVEVVARGADVITETISLTEKTVAKQVYTGTIATATAGEYELNLKSGSSYIGTDEVVVNGTDATTSRARSVCKPEWPPLNPTETANLSGTSVKLSSDGLDAVLVEASIGASASLTNDTGTQLTSINMRQAAALFLSVLTGTLSGVLANLLAFKPGGKPAGNTRVSATQAADGRSSVTLKVPD